MLGPSDNAAQGYPQGFAPMRKQRGVEKWGGCISGWLQALKLQFILAIP